MLKIIQKRNIFLTISGILVILSIIGFFSYGLNYGIDFTGGSLLEVEFSGERPSNTVIQDAFAGFDLGSINVQPTGDKGVILRFKEIDENTHQAILQKLDSMGEENLTEDNLEENETAEATSTIDTAEADSEEEKTEVVKELTSLSTIIEKRFETVGPSIGKELKGKTIKAILVALIAIVIYIAWAFRQVSKMISSWKYGMCAIAALFHDILIVVGVFVILGRYGVEVNTPFVAALLTILGYSVNDTIVIFDRVRENLPKRSESFEDIVNISINESLTRSVNTSLTTFLALFAIYLFGGATIHNFILALLIGVVAGTYSSIFIASPILVAWQSKRK